MGSQDTSRRIFPCNPNMGVYEAMDYLGALSGLSRQTRKERIPLLLKKVNLQDEYRIKTGASGGMNEDLGLPEAISPQRAQC